MTEYHMVA